MSPVWFSSFFFFNETATTEIYTLSLHDALPISDVGDSANDYERVIVFDCLPWRDECVGGWARSEEHTSELQSQSNLVCRLLLEKKKALPRKPLTGIADHVERPTALLLAETVTDL